MQSMMGKITSVEDLKEFVNSVDDLVDTVGGEQGTFCRRHYRLNGQF